MSNLILIAAVYTTFRAFVQVILPMDNGSVALALETLVDPWFYAWLDRLEHNRPIADR